MLSGTRSGCPVCSPRARRSAIERVGGYDESMVRAQDWEMNLRIRESGGVIWFTPQMRVSYRPRHSLRALARQYHDYGRWRREVVRRHPEEGEKIIGHLGFDQLALPGGGAQKSSAYAHYLHHKFFEVNYCDNGFFPLDKWFGSWGREFSPDYTPMETGLDKFISWNKPADWIGNRAYTIKTLDQRGNLSSGFTSSLTKLAPNPPTGVRAQVIDNNVLLYWTEPVKTTLPIAHILLKEGAAWATATFSFSDRTSWALAASACSCD